MESAFVVVKGTATIFAHDTHCSAGNMLWEASPRPMTVDVRGKLGVKDAFHT
jgi:hypothetical protein